MTEERIVPWALFKEMTAYGDYGLLNLIAEHHCDVKVKTIKGKTCVVAAIIADSGESAENIANE